jgi:hypothetical protein
MPTVLSIKEDNEIAVKAMAMHKKLDSLFAARNTNNEEFDKIYNAEFEFAGNLDDIGNIIEAPDISIRNRILGMKRLIESTEPILRITSDKTKAEFDSDKLENSLKRWFRAVNKTRRRNILSDMALSAILYGEIQAGLDSTKTMVEQVKEERKAHAERRAKKLPFITSTWHPSQGRYLLDDFGPTVFTREYDTTWGDIQASYGNLLTSEDLARDADEDATVVLYWDLIHYIVFVDEKVVYAEEHELPEIPIVVHLVDGSELFEEVEDQRQSALYSILKANLFEQQSILNTVQATLVFAMGLKPMFKHLKPPGNHDKKVEVNYETIPYTVEMDQGEDYIPIPSKGLIDPAVQELWAKNQRSIETSTIYDTALGAPVESNIAFSTVSLLAQQGRLPMAGPQKALENTLQSLMEMMISMLAHAKGSFEGAGIKITPASIPDDMELDVRIDVQMPQDKLQLANIAHMLKGDNLADNEWIQSNVLNITDAGAMRKRIYMDKLFQVMGDTKVATIVQQYQQRLMQGLEQPVDPNAPPPNMEEPPGIPGVPAPEMGGGMGTPGMTGMEATGVPVEGMQGIPSAQGGILPSQGRGTIPMEGA